MSSGNDATWIMIWNGPYPQLTFIMSQQQNKLWQIICQPVFWVYTGYQKTAIKLTQQELNFVFAHHHKIEKSRPVGLHRTIRYTFCEQSLQIFSLNLVTTLSWHGVPWCSSSSTPSTTTSSNTFLNAEYVRLFYLNCESAMYLWNIKRAISMTSFILLLFVICLLDLFSLLRFPSSCHFLYWHYGFPLYYLLTSALVFTQLYNVTMIIMFIVTFCLFVCDLTSTQYSTISSIFIYENVTNFW